MLEQYGIKPWNHQTEIWERNPERSLLPWDCGTGKTIGIVGLIKKNNPLNLPVMIVSIKSDKGKWTNVIKTFGINADVITKEEFKKISTSKTKKKAYDPKKKEIVEVNKIVPSPSKMKKYDYIVIDEAHFFEGITSMTYKSMVAYLNLYQQKHIWLATATPYLSTPWNLYCLFDLLGHNPDYKRFRNHFFRYQMFGTRGIWIPRSTIGGRPLEMEVGRYIRFLGKPVKMEDCVDMPPRIILEEFFELSKAQELMMKVAADEYEENVKMGLKESALTRNRKEHRICGGTWKEDTDPEPKKSKKYPTYTHLKTEKLDRLVDLCQEHKKIFIVAKHRAEIEMIEKTLKEKLKRTSFQKEIPILTFTGDNSADRPAQAKSTDSMEECIVIANAACSAAYECKTITLMVFYSMDFSWVNYDQIIGRIRRGNEIGTRTYIILLTKNSIDEDVWESVKNKRDFDESIFRR